MNEFIDDELNDILIKAMNNGHPFMTNGELIETNIYHKGLEMLVVLKITTSNKDEHGMIHTEAKVHSITPLSKVTYYL